MAMKRIFSSALAGIILLSTVSCGDNAIVRQQTEQATISLSWWGNDARHEYTIEAVEKFQILHPEIKVRINYSEWSGYESRSRVQMISKTESDVMQINFNWLDEYSPDGEGYYDINKLTDIVDLSSFSEDMLKYGTVNGKLNGIPIAMNCMSVYINKTIYEQYGLEVPRTWDDFFAAAKLMKKDGIFPLSGGSKQMWLFCMSYVEQKSGKKFITDDKKLGFGRDEIKMMIEMYCKLVEEKVMPPIEQYERINVNDGKYAGIVAWVSDAINYCGTAIESGYDYTVADYTAIDPAKTGEGWTAKPATLYAVSANTEHPKEAAMLLDYLLNSKETALLQGVEKGIPLSVSARKYLEEAGQLSGLQYDASQLMENNPRITPMDPFVEKNETYETFIDVCTRVIYGKADVSEATSELYTTLKQLYSS
ncbi:MAG: carbohydrate ABC transporter substrate-binding protein [Ruminococcus sp.]|nr:carbohydrate ABC transporter substrate-binding protein [Ruminococcus sp.]